MLSFSYTRSASGNTNAVFQSIFPMFLCRLCRIWLCANVLNCDTDNYCSLLVRIDCVAMKPECMKAIFSWMKNPLFCSQFYSQWNAGICILGLWNSKIFWGGMPPDPLEERDLNGPLLVQSVTLFKPASYFNYYWNPCAGQLNIHPLQRKVSRQIADRNASHFLYFTLDRRKFLSYLCPLCGIDWSIIWITLQNNMTNDWFITHIKWHGGSKSTLLFSIYYYGSNWNLEVSVCTWAGGEGKTSQNLQKETLGVWVRTNNEP